MKQLLVYQLNDTKLSLNCEVFLGLHYCCHDTASEYYIKNKNVSLLITMSNFILHLATHLRFDQFSNLKSIFDKTQTLSIQNDFHKIVSFFLL
jgi:hypothetical protein